MKIQTPLAIAIGVLSLVLAFWFFDTLAVMMFCIVSLALASMWGEEKKRQEEHHKVWDAIQALNERLDSK